MSQYNGVLKTRNSIKYITKYEPNLLHNKQLSNHHNGPYGKESHFNCLGRALNNLNKIRYLGIKEAIPIPQLALNQILGAEKKAA